MASAFMKKMVKNLNLVFLKITVVIIVKPCDSGSFLFGTLLIIHVIVFFYYLLLSEGPLMVILFILMTANL